MNGTNRRNDASVANAVWGSVEGVTPILEKSNNNSRNPAIMEPKTQQLSKLPKQEIDAASSLLLMTLGFGPGIKQQHRVRHHREQAQGEHQRTLKSNLLDSLMKQRQQDRWLALPTSRCRGIRKKFPKTHPMGFDELKFNERVEEVKEFVLEHGHGRIPVSYPRNQGLARWSKRQRYHYKVYLKNKKLTTLDESHKAEKCHMTQERLNALNTACFCFDLQVARWDRNYQLLKRSKSLSTKHTNYELKKWIGTQRFQMSLLKRGEKSYLNAERIQKLNDIDFSWQDDELGSKIKNNTITTTIGTHQHQQHTPATISFGTLNSGELTDHCGGKNLMRSFGSIPLEVFVIYSAVDSKGM